MFWLCYQNIVTISLVSSINIERGYYITITGLKGASSVTGSEILVLQDGSGGCQHQNLFASALNDTSLNGTALWSPVDGSIRAVTVSSVLQV